MTTEKYAHCTVGYPVRHRRKIPFEPRIRVPQACQERLQAILDLDHELDRFILGAEDYLRLLSDAIASNIHASVHLEGNPLPEREARRLTRESLRGGVRGPNAARSTHHQEVLNHIYVWADPGPLRGIWSGVTAKVVHAFLFTEGEIVESPGSFRAPPNVPSEIVTDEGQVTFITAPSEAIGEELAALFTWLNETGSALHPVIAASIFFHEFESIHPFENGNGRTGRALFHAYLQLRGLRNAHLCMIEQELAGNDPELYYRVLGWTDQSKSYTELIDYFLDGVLAAYRKAQRRLRKLDLLSSSLDETAKRLLIQAKKQPDWFSVRTATQWIANRSSQTIRRHLSLLVEKGALEVRGRTVTKRYRFANPARAFHEALARRIEKQEQ